MSMETPIISGSTTALDATATEYNFFDGGGADWTATATDYPQVVSVAGTIKKLRVNLETAPGAGKSYAFHIMLNGSQTALTVTISDAATTATDSSNSFAVVAGDVLSIRCTPSGTPATGNAYWGCVFEGAANTSVLMFRGDLTLGPSVSAVNYQGLRGAGKYDATEEDVQGIISTGGNIKNLRVKLTVAPGVGKSWAVVLMVDGSPSTLTVTISDADTEEEDVTHTVAVTAGQKVSLRFTPSGTPTATQASTCVQWEPTTDGESICLFGYDDAPSNASSEYSRLNTTTDTWATTETDRTDLMPVDVTCRNLYVENTNAPGTGNTRLFALRDDASSTALTVTLSGTDNAESLTGTDVSVAGGSLVNWITTPNSTPDAPGGVRLGMTIFITPVSSTSIKTINGLAKASVKTYNGLAIASVKTINGLA